jgi:hypothetical protein
LLNVTAAPHCNCERCQERRRWDAIARTGDLAEIGKLIEELIDRLIEAEEELAMREVLLDMRDQPTSLSEAQP